MSTIAKKVLVALAKYFVPLVIGLGGSLAIRPAHAACEVSNAQSH